VDYAEGIYVGYKWYETADAEGYWKSAGGYEKVVQYPFGYGLSYTTFKWEVHNWTVEDGKITVTVDVTNTGDYPGQDVVQLYYTPTYDKSSGIEKSAVNLCSFAKTEVLDAAGGENCSQRLTLSFEIQDMASYSESANSGNGAYVLEQGNYTISLRSDSHTVVEPALGKATYTYKADSTKTYTSYSGSNGTESIQNLFGSGTSDGIAVDGSDTEDGIESVWLSRANFAGTFSSEKAQARLWNSKLNTNNLYTKATADAWDAAWEEVNGTYNPVQGSEKVYTLYENGEYTEWAYFFGDPDNYDSDEWETLLNQLSKSELQALTLHGYIHEEAIASIGKPRTNTLDGPSQIGSFNADNPGVGYPMATVLAQSWSTELAKSFGLAVGQEAVSSGRSGWYAPGVNLHRSPFGGRNYEYYSEDSYLSGMMCSATVRGALNAGVYTYIKHFIGYDQESYRDGLYCWMTEQTLRETYLRPYKMAIDAGASGIMTSYGRLGSVWSGGSEALLTDLLRNEWGFKGSVITDYADHQDFMNGDQMLRAGGDIWMDGYLSNGSYTKSTTSSAYNYQVRQAAKHVIYTWANAAYEHQKYVENGDDVITVERPTNTTFRWWWAVVGAVDAVCVIGAAVLVVVAFKKPKQKAVES
jgi:beta-glucosidase